MIRIIVLACLCALVFTGVAQAGYEKQPQLHKSASVVRFFTEHSWMIAPNQKSCSAVPWKGTCSKARKKFAHHKIRLERLRHDRWHTLPSTSDWRTAVRIAQRVYPGTEGWLLSCSASEGSWGAWVPNREGSGVGGWMQMFPSTFWRMWGTAKEDLTARGFTVPASTASWYSPLGQALASAWGLTNGRRGEWAGSGC